MSFQLLKATQVAQRLNISRSQAFYLMRIGEIPTVKFGKLVRVRPEDLEAFINANTSKSALALNQKLTVAAVSSKTISQPLDKKGDHYEG